MQSLIKLGKFINNPKNSNTSTIFQSYHRKIVAVQHLDELAGIHAEIAEMITLKHDDDSGNVFSKLPTDLLGEIFDYLAFGDSMAFQQVNREIFIFSHRYGAQFTSATTTVNQIDYLMDLLMSRPHQIYKLEQYVSLKQLSLDTALFIGVDKKTIRENAIRFMKIFRQLVRNNHKLEQFTIHCDNYTLLAKILEEIAGKTSIQELIIDTRQFSMGLLDSLQYVPASVQITAEEIHCDPKRVYSPVLVGTQSIKIQCGRFVGPKDLPILKNTPNLRSYHGQNRKGCFDTAWQNMIKYAPQTCAQLEELCVYYIDDFVEMLEFYSKRNGVLFPNLKRIMFRNAGVIMTRKTVCFMQQAPQVQSIFIRWNYDERFIARFIKNVVDGIVLKKNIQFRIDCDHCGMLPTLNSVIDDCVERLESFALIFCGMKMNTNFMELSGCIEFDDQVMQGKWNQENVQDENGIYKYDYYRDKTFRYTEYGSFFTPSFIFRKMMPNFVPDQFKYKCTACDLPAIF